jgi:uncharacterized protein YgiM (DUF1202 family)
MQKNHILPLCFVLALAFSGCAAGALLELSAVEAAGISAGEVAALGEAGLALEGASLGAAEIAIVDEAAFNRVLARTRLVENAASGVPEVKIHTSRFGWRTLGRVVGRDEIELLDLNGRPLRLDGELVSVRGAKRLNLRKGPGVEHEIITAIKDNQLVIKLGESSNGWYRVRAGENVEGYMNGSYLLPIVASNSRRRR